jgi:intracellular septation protein
MTAAPKPPPTDRAAPAPWLQLTIDYGPLGIFFVAYCLWDILPATAAMLAATVLALGLSFALTRQVASTTLVTSAMMLIFGALTLLLSDPSYLKLQSTVISGLFSVVLFAALVFSWPLLRVAFGPAWPMSETGWRILTLRFALFFAAMAGLNEVISRTQSTETWVHWNVIGQTVVSLVFMVAQWPLLNRHLEAEALIEAKEPADRR